jgi:cystathionine beta-lyase/cystathionine gamma-synthase
MKSGNYILGNNVKEFEEQWAKYCNSKHCVAVNSGTSALYLSCLLANVVLKKKFKNDKFRWKVLPFKPTSIIDRKFIIRFRGLLSYGKFKLKFDITIC